MRLGAAGLGAAAAQQAGDVGVGGVVANEDLLPEAIEGFQFHAQGHAHRHALVGANDVVLGLQLPAVADVAVQLGVFLGADPTAVGAVPSPCR